MKRIISGAIFLSALIVAASCGGPEGERAKTGDAVEESLIVGEKTLTADLESSNVEWLGKKPGGQHNGIVNLKSGSIELQEGKPVGGSFVLDMASISVLDLTDEEMNNTLRMHLLSDDFFDVENYPEARFVITSVEASDERHLITGNLTVKDITRSLSFIADINIEDDVFTASTPQFLIDRTEWDIKYMSNRFFDNLKDKFINDEIGLKINLRATL